MTQRYPYEEFTTVWWVAAVDDIVDTSAPTAAEVNAGTDITCFLTKDGLATASTTATVDGGSLCSATESSSVGSIKYDLTLKGYRDNEGGGDTFWNLSVYAAFGFLVVRRGVAYVDPAVAAAADIVEVYPVQMAQPSVENSAADTNTMFSLGLMVSAGEDVDLKAVVAA